MNNEKHNGILRRFIPKASDIGLVCKKVVRESQDWMNWYPRKIHKWLAPLTHLAKGMEKGFILSAEQDHIDSQYYLGALLESGRGISQNSHRANQYFSDAAEQGHAYAQYELGYSYMYGRGTAKDPVLAFAWLSIAYATASDLNDRELMHQADSSRQLLALEMSSNDIIEARLKAMNFSPVKQR